MRIAYLIMIHNNFPQVKWIINAIYSHEDSFIIHIDKNFDLTFVEQVKRYVGKRSNVKYLPSRRVLRFGWSMVETELRAIRALISSKDEWSYFINVSGQDYPIKSISTIKPQLTARMAKEFRRGNPV
jgi:hypothetical protein